MPERKTSRERVAEMRKKERAQERRRRMFFILGTILVVAIVGGAVAYSQVRTKPATPHPAPGTASPSQVPIPLRQTPPPWGLPSDPATYIHAAGLQILGSEQLDVHYHAHLDIYVNGKHEQVPAYIGFDIANGNQFKGLAFLHTHRADGVIHIESPKNVPYTLGQFFTEWDVQLDAKCIGGLCSDKTHELRWYVDGKNRDGDPAQLILEPHQEIVLWYGPIDEKANVPSSYKFPSGE